MTLPFLNFEPPVIGHRGLGYAPENTMSAFVKAAQLGLQWIEFDVMQAACGEPIIFHDDELDRTTNAVGQVIQFPYTYLQKLDAGSWFDPRFAGESIPNLSHVMAFLRDTKMSANVELKPLPGHEEQLVIRVLQELQPHLHQSPSSILFSSFSIEALQFLRKYSHDCYIGFLMHEWMEEWKEICTDLQCISVHVNHDILTMENAQRIKQSGRQLLSYTVNDVARAHELFAMGVDAIFSDFPDKMLAIE